MKSKETLWSDVSVLIVALLAVTAFLRGAWQFWTLITVFAFWSGWAVYQHLIPFVKGLKAQKEAKKLRKQYEHQEQQRRAHFDVDIADPMSVVLLRHINHRISAKLKALYPDATWDWCSENVEEIVAKGGIGRICIHGIPDFNYAEVSLDQNAKIEYQLLKIVPLTAKQTTADGEKGQQPVVKEIDPQVWYERQGKTVLQNLIVDLSSRGHTSLTIEENGDVLIRQADDKPLKKHVFQSIPEKVYWQRLKKIFERDGMATDITDDGLLLSW